MTTERLFEICEQHGLYCEQEGEYIHLTDKHGRSFETIKVVSGKTIHSSEYGDINVYAWLGY